MVALGFPGDATAELNLVPVDRVVAGILAALTVPEAIGNRIHLATDNRIRSEDMVRITREELGANVRLSDPTLYRNVTLPLVKATLTWLERAQAGERAREAGHHLRRLRRVGPADPRRRQRRAHPRPAHPAARTPSTRSACSAATTGTCRSSGACATRTRRRGASGVWVSAIEAIEHRTGHEIGALPAADFQRLIDEEIDLRAFRLRSAPSGAVASARV